VSYEPGFGDCLMMARFFAGLGKLDGAIIVETAPQLVSLLSRSIPGVTFVEATHWRQPASIDVHVPLMQLPTALGVANDADVHVDAAYLTADPDRVEQMRSRLHLDPDYRHVGIVWRGDRRNHRDRWRSTSLADWAPLSEVSHVRFHALQVDATPEQLAAAPIQLEPTHEGMATFTDAAAIITSLDLVISVDTAAVHLAGALGRPVWLANSLISDWRWGRGAGRSMWYPTLRQFRQTDRDNWEPVFASIAQALATR